jgi:hypothetical protein
MTAPYGFRLGHLQPSCSIAFDGSLPSDTFRAPGGSVTEALGHELP